MSVCECGYHFGRTPADSIHYESYAVIPDEGYRDIIMGEAALISEKDEAEWMERSSEGSLYGKILGYWAYTLRRMSAADVCSKLLVFAHDVPQHPLLHRIR